MTTSPQDGQSAAGWAGAQDSPLAVQVCRVAQGKGDAQDPVQVPGLHALSPASDATRPVVIDRRQTKDPDALEMPPIPNPFPELCCSPLTSVLSEGLIPRANSREKQVIKVYSEDETSRALEVPSDITARDVCQLLILKNHYVDDNSWTLFEHLSQTGVERTVEDHELLMEVMTHWGMEEDNKLYLRKNYAKYEFFKNPMEKMVSFATEMNGDRSPTQILQVSTSKEPRHLQLFSEFSTSNVYMSLAGKKKHGAPTPYGFCLKYGMQLYQNYMHPCQGRSACSSQSVSPMELESTEPILACGGRDIIRIKLSLGSRPVALWLGQRSISENSLVAMDFSGQKSRVIDNPTEALSVAVEEGLAWKKKGFLHRSQPWFHHRISRDEAQQLIIRQGPVDGVFLVRDSQSNPRTFVLSMSHGQKIKHFQIIPVEDDGELFHTLDDGHTKFTDLIQLVEFYQLNKGVLPCKLKHYCARMAV
ncbi:Growth factor receptor-bound protein 14 [Apodemus speciosus]|uniref:Growth factor receptor-bound protein 14 n=1 Tax=Apodemus speciosus TaxID=105296 RepID=A0ABQ0EH25_APOSI